MMLLNTVRSLINFTIQRELCKGATVTKSQRIFFSAKPPIQPFQKPSPDDPQQRRKQIPLPKITVISSDDSISVMTLEEAQHLSKRRDLKLVKIVDLDTKAQRPVYKLMTGTEYHAEDLKQRELRKKQKQSSGQLKGEKLLMLNSGITTHDLETNVKKIQKWLLKNYEVRVVVNGNLDKSEDIYKFLEETLKSDCRFVQKRSKGNDIKFQILPLKEQRSNQEFVGDTSL